MEGWTVSWHLLGILLTGTSAWSKGCCFAMITDLKYPGYLLAISGKYMYAKLCSRTTTGIFFRRCSIWQIDFLLTFFCSIDYRIKIAFYHRYKHYIYLYFIHFERDNHLREVGFLNYLDNVWGTIKCVSVVTSLKAADDGLSVSQHP